MAKFVKIPLFTIYDYKNNDFSTPASYLPLVLTDDSSIQVLRNIGLWVSNNGFAQQVYRFNNGLKYNSDALSGITMVFNSSVNYNEIEERKVGEIFGGPGVYPVFYGQRVRVYEELRKDILNKGLFEVNGLKAYVLINTAGSVVFSFSGKLYKQYITPGILDAYGLGFREFGNVNSLVREYGDYGYIARPANIVNSPYSNILSDKGYSNYLEMLDAEGAALQGYIDSLNASAGSSTPTTIAPQGGTLQTTISGSPNPDYFSGNRTYLYMSAVNFFGITKDQEQYIRDGTTAPSNERYGYVYSGASAIMQVRANPTQRAIKPYRTEINGKNSSGPNITYFYKPGSQQDITEEEYWDGYPNGGDDSNTQEKNISSGNGDYDNTNDPIEFPAVPLKTASLSGMVSLWNPEIQEISQLNSYLWSPEVIDIMKKFWNDPMDGIISLSLVPIDVGATEYREVRIGGNYTGIQMKRIFNQIRKLNMGKLKFAEYFGSFADYSPYTTVYLYLPYIGMTQLNVDDIMDCDLELEYMIDLFDGTTVANLRSVRVWDGLAGIVGTWAGNCQTQIPVSSVSYREMLAGAARAGIGMLTGSMVAGAALGAQPQPQWKNNPFYVPETGEFMSYRTLEGDNTNVLNERAMGGSLQMQGVQGMNMGLNAKGQVSRGGNANCTAGALSVQTPYLIINRPVSAMPDGINDFIGYPSYSRGRLGDQQGFTQVLYVKLENLTATQKERAELDQILKGGVIF